MSNNMSDGVALICAGDNVFIDNLKENLAELFDENDIVPVSLKTFPNKEVYAQLQDNVRRKISFIFWNFEGYDGDFDPNVGLQWLHVMNDATRRASASEINNMLPFFPYLRQDRKDKPRSPITARMVARQLEQDGVDRVVSVDPHIDQAQGFFDIPFDILPYFQLFADKDVFNEIGKNKYIIVGPDIGSAKRLRSYRNWVQTKYGVSIPIALIDKGRDTETGETEVYNFIGKPEDVDGATVVMIDDIISTAGSMVDGGNFLRDKYNAKGIIACGTHGEFACKDGVSAEDRLKDAGFKVYTTDSIPRSREYIENNAGWLTVKSLGPMFAQAAKRTYKGDSLSDMFNDYRTRT